MKAHSLKHVSTEHVFNSDRNRVRSLVQCNWPWRLIAAIHLEDYCLSCDVSLTEELVLRHCVVNTPGFGVLLLTICSSILANRQF